MKTTKNSIVKKICFMLAVCLTVLSSSMLGFVCAAASAEPDSTLESVSKDDILAASECYDDATVANFLRARSQFVDDGTYYLNNKYYGKYIKYGGTLSTQSGTISALGDTIRWSITYTGSAYLIRPLYDTTKYLAVTGNSTVEMISVSSSSIPTTCQWQITVAPGGGCLIKSVNNSQYLTLSGSSLVTTSSTGSNGNSVWRVASINYYGNTSSSTKRELNSSFGISGENVDKGETITPVITKSPSNALWADAADFTYTTSYGSKISISDDIITAIATGYVSITATHKVTGLSKSFSLTIFAGTFDVYIYASGVSPDNAAAGSDTGHGWIKVTSNSSHEYTVGHYQLPAGETVAIGRWGSQIDEDVDGDFMGIWYNREIYEYHVNGKYGSYVYSYQTVSKTTLDQVSALITSTYSGYEFMLNNCVQFAVSAWNLCSTSSNRLSTLIVSPNGLASAIENLSLHHSGSSHGTPVAIVCGFYNGSSYVEHVVTDY